METYVYIDMLFLLNFCVNLCVISGAERLCGLGAKFWRRAAGAALAAGLYILFFVLGVRGALSILPGILGIAGGVYVGYAPTDARVFRKLCVCALLLTITLGGGSYAAYHVLSIRGGFPVWLLLLCVPFAYFAVQYLFRRIERKERKAVLRAAYANVKVSLHGKQAELTALVDTGHSLMEPVSRKPVIIAEFAALKGILPKEAAELFARKGDLDPELAASAFVRAGLAERFHLVPYRSVGEKSGLLIGLRADGVYVDGDLTEAVTCVYNGRISEESEYNALVGAEIIWRNGK